MLRLFTFLMLIAAATPAPPQITKRPADADRAVEVSQWRHVPKASVSPENDSVSPEIRAARDLFFDSRSAAAGPLDTPEGQGANVIQEQVGIGPEIPASDVIAVASFDDYQPRLTASRRSIYTELHLRVERLISAPSGLEGGAQFTVILWGGVVKTASRVISYGIHDSAFQLQPGHRYVFFLEHVKAGDFYIVGKSWELRDGRVFPNAPDDLMRANHGTSLYAGMREDEFLSVIPAIVAAERGSASPPR